MIVPMKFSTPNRTGGMSTSPATIDAKARTNGSMRATGSAHAPRPARNRSARATSDSVISTYRPQRRTSG